MKGHHTKTSGTQDDHHTVPVRDRLPQSGPEARISGSQLASTSRPLQYLHPHPPPIPDPPTYTTRNNMSLITVSVQETNHESVSNTLYQQVLSWSINDHRKASLLSAYFQCTSRWCGDRFSQALLYFIEPFDNGVAGLCGSSGGACYDNGYKKR